MARADRTQILFRASAHDRALIATAAQKLGVSANEFLRMRALATVREDELEARIRAAVAAEVSAHAAGVAAEVAAAVSAELAALDGRLKNALTQIHAAIKETKKP